MEVYVIGFLCGLIAVQQYYFLSQIQKLVDKVMSRSYTEYVKAKEPTKISRLEADTEAPDDLRTLQEFAL